MNDPDSPVDDDADAPKNTRSVSAVSKTHETSLMVLTICSLRAAEAGGAAANAARSPTLAKATASRRAEVVVMDPSLG